VAIPLLHNIKHIAVIRLSAMGDVAMTVPVLRALAKQHPELKITMVSRPFYKPFFDEIPNLDFLAFDAKGKHKGFFGLLKLFLELKALHIDAFADLHDVLRSKIIRNLFALSAIKTAAVDKGKSEKSALTRTKNKIFKPLTPMAQRHLKVFETLGFTTDLSKPEFPLAKDLSPEVLEITEPKSGFKWIGIAPFAQHDSKVYHVDLMQQTIALLARGRNHKIFLFGGGKSEIEILNNFSKDFENVIVIAGKITFEQELQLISNLDVMLSMDSGNAHIAAIYGIPTITLWGATHPFAGFAPFGQAQENALVSDREHYPKLPTSVYGNKYVEGYEDVMRTILPETIVEKIKTILK